MNALAITDHGNMFGVLDFFETAQKKALNLCLVEIYVARGSRFTKDGKNMSGDHLILIAKEL